VFVEPRRRRVPDPRDDTNPPAPPPPAHHPSRGRPVVEPFSIASASARPGEAARALGRAMSGTMGIELFRSEEMQLMQVKGGEED